jgi:hypothetical protein
MPMAQSSQSNPLPWAVDTLAVTWAASLTSGGRETNVDCAGIVCSAAAASCTSGGLETSSLEVGSMPYGCAVAYRSKTSGVAALTEAAAS